MVLKVYISLKSELLENVDEREINENMKVNELVCACKIFWSGMIGNVTLSNNKFFLINYFIDEIKFTAQPLSK